MWNSSLNKTGLSPGNIFQARRISLVVLFVISLAYSPHLMATKMMPAEPDPWFSIWVQIEADSLPRGVEFKHVAFPENKVILGYFTNSEPTPFYLVARSSDQHDWVRDLPPNMVPNHIAVRGSAFRLGDEYRWNRQREPGIRMGRLIKRSPGESLQAFDISAYLGSSKVDIRGTYGRDYVNRAAKYRFILDVPLPEPLRLSGHPRFLITNEGPVPLYTGIVFPRPVGWVTEVPEGFLATHKIVEGKTYYGETLRATTQDGWKEARSIDARLTDRELTGYLPDFKLKQVFRDNRPSDVKLPDPQPFEITAFHGTREVTIRGRLLYDLNPNYDPLAEQGPAKCLSCIDEMCGACQGHGPTRVKRYQKIYESTY